ncbi:MAG: C-GCAxxG-C-C family protein [Spirochaetaceae bacterium]
MDTRSDIAKESFGPNCNCSQAVFTSYCEEFGISKEFGLKLSIGFGGGVAHNGEICGAVSGAILAIGLKFGNSKDETYKIINKYTNKFKSKNKTLNCSELLGYNLNKEEELIKARESGIFSNLCPKLVKDSVEILDEIIINYESQTDL